MMCFGERNDKDDDDNNDDRKPRRRTNPARDEPPLPKNPNLLS